MLRARHAPTPSQSVNMGHEKTKESDLKRPLPLTKERAKSVMRCGAEGANRFHLLQVPLTEDVISFYFWFTVLSVSRAALSKLLPAHQ